MPSSPNHLRASSSGCLVDFRRVSSRLMYAAFSPLWASFCLRSMSRLDLPLRLIPVIPTIFLWETLPAPRRFTSEFTRYLNDPYLLTLRQAFERSLAGVEKAGIWLSGGIDSSAALLLASWILGPENVSAIHLDFGYRPDETERAHLVAEHLDVRLVVEEMTLDDHLRLLDAAVRNQRSPSDFSTQSLMAAHIAEREGLNTVLSGLGVDEIMGGYPEHVEASPGMFAEVEDRLLWRCQSFYAWVQKVQGAGAGVDVRFPFLDRDLIAVSRFLPRDAKVEGRETKILLRRALSGDLPEEIVEAGRIAGTKGGFTPSIAGWWREGLGEHVREQIRDVPSPSGWRVSPRHGI